MFGIEKFGNKNDSIPAKEAIPLDETIDSSIPQSDEGEGGVDMSRRAFLRSGIASVAAVGLAGVSESVDAKGLEMQLNFVGYKPSEHEKKLIMLKVRKAVPNAVSVEIHLNDRSAKRDELSSVDVSIITADDKVFEGGGAGFYEKGLPLGDLINRALERLDEVK